MALPGIGYLETNLDIQYTCITYYRFLHWFLTQKGCSTLYPTQWPATLPIFQSIALAPSHLSNVNQRCANFGLTTCHRTWSTTHLWTFATLRYSSIWEPIYTGNKWCTKWSETVPRTIPTGWDRCQWPNYWSCAFIEDFRPLTRVDRRHFVR